MPNINDLLFKYIIQKYGSIAAFSDYSGIPLLELNAVLLKENLPIDIRSGLQLCKKLNIDAEKLVFGGEIEDISEFKSSLGIWENADGAISVNEFHDRYMRLSELEKKEVLDFVNKISDRHEK